ncbi:MAG TPA: SpoVG family protein [Candidatus Brocadiia bacterium]|nr:SpoVG family protein [Candidatus Brocadiia bacterium]
MNITEVKVKLMPGRSDRLQAFCSITIENDFVVRDLKVIEGTNGPFVAMPSRKLTERCPNCGYKNHLRAGFCNDCGAKLPEFRQPPASPEKAKFHVDIAHPINTRCRERLQQTILKAYEEEVRKSKLPGYKPQDYFDSEEFDDAEHAHPHRDMPNPYHRDQRQEQAPDEYHAAPENDPAETGNDGGNEGGGRSFGEGIL